MGGGNTYPFPAAKLRKIFKMDAKNIKKVQFFALFLICIQKVLFFLNIKEYSIKFPSSEECY